MNITRIAITGSSGLAEAISLMMKSTSNTCSGAEGSNPFTIKSVRIEDQLNPDSFDVFINHAHVDFLQVKLLYQIYNLWKDDSEKYIINISSRAAQPNVSMGYIYSAQKAALNHLSNNLVFNSDKRCRITTINLGLLEHSLPSLTYTEVAKVIKYLLLLPKHIEISDLTLQHSANYKEVQKKKDKLINQ